MWPAICCIRWKKRFRLVAFPFSRGGALHQKQLTLICRSFSVSANFTTKLEDAPCNERKKITSFHRCWILFLFRFKEKTSWMTKEFSMRSTRFDEHVHTFESMSFHPKLKARERSTFCFWLLIAEKFQQQNSKKMSIDKSSSQSQDLQRGELSAKPKPKVRRGRARRGDGKLCNVASITVRCKRKPIIYNVSTNEKFVYSFLKVITCFLLPFCNVIMTAEHRERKDANREIVI